MYETKYQSKISVKFFLLNGVLITVDQLYLVDVYQGFEIQELEIL